MWPYTEENGYLTYGIKRKVKRSKTRLWARSYTVNNIDRSFNLRDLTIMFGSHI